LHLGFKGREPLLERFDRSLDPHEYRSPAPPRTLALSHRRKPRVPEDGARVAHFRTAEAPIFTSQVSQKVMNPRYRPLTVRRESNGDEDDVGRAPICPYCGVTALPAETASVIDSGYLCDNPDCDAFGDNIEF
jgi:hypothetical protein